MNHWQSDWNITTSIVCNLKKINCFLGAIPARLVLYFLSWSGFLVSFMMRNDINIALVSMVRTKNDTLLESGMNATITPNRCDNKVPIAAEGGEFEWTTSVQSIILGSFYACYVLSQVRLFNNKIGDCVSKTFCWTHMNIQLR